MESGSAARQLTEAIVGTGLGFAADGPGFPALSGRFGGANRSLIGQKRLYKHVE